MNRSYTKKRRIFEANEKLEKRYLNESPTRKTKQEWDNLVTKGAQEINGFYTCTGKGNSPDMNFAKEMARNKCEQDILGFLGKDSGTLSNIEMEDESTWKNTNGSFDYYVTMKINKSDIS